MTRPPDHRKPDWHKLAHLIEAWRNRFGLSDEQADYLRSIVGVAWAKGYFEAERRQKEEEEARRAAARCLPGAARKKKNGAARA